MLVGKQDTKHLVGDGIQLTASFQPSLEIGQNTTNVMFSEPLAQSVAAQGSGVEVPWIAGNELNLSDVEVLVGVGWATQRNVLEVVGIARIISSPQSVPLETNGTDDHDHWQSSI